MSEERSLIDKFKKAIRYAIIIYMYKDKFQERIDRIEELKEAILIEKDEILALAKAIKEDLEG